jgi:hypothetical protein
MKTEHGPLSMAEHRGAPGNPIENSGVRACAVMSPFQHRTVTWLSSPAVMIKSPRRAIHARSVDV